MEVQSKTSEMPPAQQSTATDWEGNIPEEGNTSKREAIGERGRESKEIQLADRGADNRSNTSEHSPWKYTLDAMNSSSGEKGERKIEGNEETKKRTTGRHVIKRRRWR